MYPPSVRKKMETFFCSDGSPCQWFRTTDTSRIQTKKMFSFFVTNWGGRFVLQIVRFWPIFDAAKIRLDEANLTILPWSLPSTNQGGANPAHLGQEAVEYLPLTPCTPFQAQLLHKIGGYCANWVLFDEREKKCSIGPIDWWPAGPDDPIARPCRRGSPAADDADTLIASPTHLRVAARLSFLCQTATADSASKI